MSDKFAFGLFDLDWDVFTQHIEGAINRVPVLEKTGVKSTVCGPGEWGGLGPGVFGAENCLHQVWTWVVPAACSWRSITPVLFPLCLPGTHNASLILREDRRWVGPAWPISGLGREVLSEGTGLCLRLEFPVPQSPHL